MFRGTNATKVQQWTDRLTRFQLSSQTVAAFCRSENVSVPSFYQWKKKLASKPNARKSNSAAGDSRRTEKPKRRLGKPTGATSFQPLELLPTNSALTTIRLPNGIEIELGGDLRVIELFVAQLLDQPVDQKGGREC